MSNKDSINNKTGTAAPDTKTAALVLALIIIGSTLVVLNSEDIYLNDKNNATLTIPDQFLAGSQGSLIIQAADVDGDPVENKPVTVTLTRSTGENYELWDGETDDKGFAQPIFTLPENVGEAELEIEIGSELFKKDVELKSSYSIIISTDKPLYQPGQIIHLRTLGFKGRNPQSEEHELTLEISDPDGNKIFRKHLLSNQFGIAAYDFHLSDQLPLGNYKIAATAGETTAEKTVSVQRYVLPKYRIQFEELRSWYLADDTVSGVLNASYIFGEPITGNVEIEAKTYYGEWQTIKTLDGELQNGLFPFSIPLSSHYFVGLDVNKGNAYLELNATITDTSGHVEKKSTMLTVSESPILLSTLGDTNVHGQESSYYFVARYPDGVPAAGAEITVMVMKKSSSTFSLPSVITDERGVARLDFTYDTTYTEMRLRALGQEDERSEYYDITLDGQDMGLKVLPDAPGYQVGEEANFQVFYAGEGGTRNVFYELLSGGFVINSGHTILEDKKADLSFTVTPDMAPMLEFRVYKIQPDLTVLKDSVVLGVGQETSLTVKIEPDREQYRPGGEVGLQFKVSDEENNGVLAALGVSIVDLSVFELQERFTGYEDIYLSLEDDFAEPQYMVLSYILGTGNTLPVEPTPEIESESLDFGVRVYQSGGAHEENAESAGELARERFTTIILMSALLGYMALFFAAYKYKMQRNNLLALVIVISLAVPLGFVMTHLADKAAMEDEDDVIDFDNEGWGWGWGDDVFLDEANDLEGDGIAPQAGGARDKNNEGSGSSEPVITITEPDHVRQYFPETWVWEPTLLTNENGVAALTLTAPDTITTWRVDALASTQNARLGTGSAEIVVFQEFFVEPDIPVEVVRNDEFPLKLMVYNYQAEDQEIGLRLEEADWFELLEGNYTRTITVGPGSVAGLDFAIKAKDVGIHDVEITASSELLSDKVIRPMTVVPDGERTLHVINGEISGEDSLIETILLSEERIENSENAYLKLQGSMKAVAVEGAEEYIHFVSGCGEQSMSTLSINILAYDIVQEQGSSEKLFEYETITTQGIQHELTFLLPAKNGEGRGIVWFPSDEDVHPWLTSWGLLTFQDALNAGFMIDEQIIPDMQTYLVSQQEDDGSFQFPERGLYETTNSILRSKVVATTAYITRALLYSGYGTDSHIKDAVSYIESNIRDQWDDPYTLSVALIVLEDANGQKSLRQDIAVRLVELKQEDENGAWYWDSQTNMIGTSEPRMWGGSSSNAIEATAYAVMALAKAGNTASAQKGVSYLLTHRIGGNFFSTQDTVVAFQALTRWGEVSVEEITLDITMNGASVETKTIDQENADLTFLLDLRPWLATENAVKLEATGSGTLLYQLYFEEFVPWEEEPVEDDLVMDVSYDSTDIAVNDAITATLDISYNGEAPQLKMILVDLRAPVGFAFTEEEFQGLVDDGTASHYELTGRQLLLYLTDIVSGENYQYSYSLTAQKPIRATLQGVNVYDMYNPQLKDVETPVEVSSYVVEG